MKTFLYMFRRYRVATLLNLFGLGVAVATFYLFMTQVIYNRTYNHSIQNHERVFRLEVKSAIFNGQWGSEVCRPFETILRGLPHVQAVMNVSPYGNQMTVSMGKKEINCRVVSMSKPGVEFFCGKLLYGSSKAWEYGPTVIISRSTAMTLFGTEKAVGKTFFKKGNDDQKMQVTVVGVSEDFPDNCTIANGIYPCEDPKQEDDGSEWSFNVYVRLDDAANKAKVERSFKKAAMTAAGFTDVKAFEKELGQTYRLTPIDDIYFTGIGMKDKGNSGLVDVLTVASVFILFIALLNLLNFTLSEVPMRIRGINTRRVMGASQGSLRLQLIMENVFVAVVAIALAFLMLVAFQRSETCMKLVIGSIRFADHWGLVAAMVVSALAVGALSAVIPAWYSTSFAPALVLKGSFGLSPRGRKLRMAIMAVQFCVAFVLAIYIGVMVGQSRYIFNTDYGFDKDEVFYVYLSNEGMQKKAAIRTELQKLACVENVGFAQTPIGSSDGYMGWGRGSKDRHMNMQVLICDTGYVKTMGLKIEEGRNFRSSDATTGAYIANRTMMNRYKWLKVGEPIGDDKEWGGMAYDIVGVCNNFKLKSMRQDNSDIPVLFLVGNPDFVQNWGDRCYCLFVRVAKGSDKIAAKHDIEKVLNRMDPGEVDYKMTFLDEDLQYLYEDEFRFISQVKFFAIICMIITIIGVFSLTMFETEYRRKEIGIRKVMGSSVGAVVGLFVARYTVPLVLSFVVAAPVGYWLCRQWLQSFAEHTPLYWWLFPLSFVCVSVVVIATVAAQSWKVATENPVESIKTE